MNRTAGKWVALILLAAIVVTPVVMFVVQNMERSSELSLNLGVAAYELAQPTPVPLLMLASLGLGLLIGGGWGVAKVASQSRELRRLKREASYASADGGASSGSLGASTW